MIRVECNSVKRAFNPQHCYLTLYESGYGTYICDATNSNVLLYINSTGKIFRCRVYNLDRFPNIKINPVNNKITFDMAYAKNLEINECSNWASINYTIYHESYFPVAEPDKTLLLANDDMGGVTLVTFSKIPLLSITQEGTLRLYPNLPSSLPFVLDKFGRIVTI